MRFVSSTAASIGAAVALGSLFKGGGLKLARSIQRSADAGNVYSTNVVQSVTKLRKALDELEGLRRYTDNSVDPYSKLVFEDEAGKLTTGKTYSIANSDILLENGNFITRSNINQATGGATQDPAAIWTLKDDIQQKLVKQARRLPYELPALYVAQRAVTDPLFGNNQDKKKVNWYNPADVIADFTKQSITNILAVTSLGAAGGAVFNRAKFYTNAPYAANQNLGLTQGQVRRANLMADTKIFLEQVGQDVGRMSNQISRISSSAAGAFNMAVDDAQRAQTSPTHVLHRARQGAQRAAQVQGGQGTSTRMQRATQKGKALFLGSTDGNGETYNGLIDLVPGMRGFTSGFAHFGENFRVLKKGYDVVSGAVSFDEALNTKIRGSSYLSSERLQDAMRKIQKQHNSKFSSFADQVNKLMGRGGPGDGATTRGEWAAALKQQEYRKQIAFYLRGNGVDENIADDFSRTMFIKELPNSSGQSSHISKRIRIGRRNIIAESDDDFYGELAKRFRRQVGIEKAPDSNVIKRSIEQADSFLTRKEFDESFARKVRETWNVAYNQSVVPYGHTILKPQKAVYQDFVGPLTVAKEEFLRRRTAQVLGVKLVDADGRKIGNSIVNNELKKRGFDTDNFNDLRSFLIRNKAMSSQSSSGGYNLFGMKQLLVDEAFEKGIFNYMGQEDQKVVRNLAGRIKRDDPVSASIGFSRLDGVYQNRSGEIVDYTRIKSMVTGIKDFVSKEFQIPLVKFNPLQMLGVGGPTGVSASAPFQIVAGKSVQPFGGMQGHAADVYMWTKQKNGIFGPKGSLSFISGDELGNVSATQLRGTFRQINPNEANIFSRAASFAANRGAIMRSAEVEAAEAGRDLTFAERMKSLFNVNEEQPNSLFRLASRFRSRRTDIYNPNVFSRFMQEDTIMVGGRHGKKITLTTSSNGRYSVIDDTGKELYGHKDVLDAYDIFRRSTFQYGTPTRVMAEVESSLGLEKLSVFGKTRSVSEMSETELVQAGKVLREMLEADKSDLTARGIETAGLARSFSRVSRRLDDTELSAVSAMAEKSPSISTRVDELRNEIYRYMLERQTYLKSSGDPSALLRTMDDAILSLRKRGIISAGQEAEARAAGFSTFLNLSSFKTFDKSATTAGDLANSLFVARNARVDGSLNSLRNMLTPFTQGTSELIETSGLKRATAAIRPAFKKKFGTAAYQMDDAAVPELGTQGATFVPTFGTVVKEVGIRRAALNATGFTTYRDPQAFSFASVPISHSIERLNRYFGTVGGSLDPNKYSGPLSLYSFGMVGQRVLPVTAAAAGFLTIDRTVGGFVNEKDDRGERVYSPFLLGKAGRGVVEAQAAISGVFPGGMGYEEKKEQLLEGEVAIRQGRYWPLGVTPFEGGKIMYYRPSWYRRMQAGAMYTSDSFGSPVEKFLFGYDFSPLRPLDPYRFERQHYHDRPYPVTGEYFSGPYGPLTDVLNATVGKVLKPQLKMHEKEVDNALSQYVFAGVSGAYNPTGLLMSGRANYVGQSGMTGRVATSGNEQIYSTGAMGGMAQGALAERNAQLSSRAAPMQTGRSITFGAINAINSTYVDYGQYGPPPTPGVVPPNIISAGTPISSANANFMAGQLGYKLQETAGIYGFGFASAREGLGFGQSDFEPQRSVLQSAQKAYGSTRAFWDLNLGGLGDVPLSAEGALGNIEISEVVRRFIPKERTNVNYLNPIRNTMADQYPFLPGSDYFTNFQQGDPFSKVQEGELRLPGVAYERLNPFAKGYDRLTQLDILGDVAPYSKEFRELNRSIESDVYTAEERMRLEGIREQVESQTSKYDFSEYTYKGKSPEELGIDAKGYALGRVGEYIAHRDTYFNTKFLHKRTAQEDWERRNVYGSTFPEWQRPFESFFEPMMNKATQRNPLVAGAGMAIVGSMFGKTARAKAFGSITGFGMGAGSSIIGKAQELISGERFIPQERKKELALEEYTDMLNYVKSTSLAKQAESQGDMSSANQFRQAARRTMYGVDIYGQSVETLSLSIPKRKREHFKAMIAESNPEERERILSTSGRLERRIYQAAWGMEVEERPDLVEYFSRHELPDASWEGWHPNTNMEHVKIKMGQSMGIQMSQMGYYPQQIKEANLTGPSYPSFYEKNSQDKVAAQLRQLMSRNGIQGSVTPVVNGFGGSSVQILSGAQREFAF